MLHDSAAADVKTVAGTVNMDKIVAGVVSVMATASATELIHAPAWGATVGDGNE